MTASPQALDIPKYTGSADDGPVEDWFHLFELHASAASWSERDMVSNFNDYVTGEAFRFYLTHIFENDESWDKIKEEMISRFHVYVADPLIMQQLEKSQLGRRNHPHSPLSNHHQCQPKPRMTRSSTSLSCSNPPEKTKQNRTPGMISARTMDKVKPPFAERYSRRVPSRPNTPPDFTSVQESRICASSLWYHTPAIAKASDAFTASYTCDPPPGFKSRHSSMKLIPQPVLHGIASFAKETSAFIETDLSLEARGAATSTAASANNRPPGISRCLDAINRTSQTKPSYFPPAHHNQTTNSVCSLRDILPSSAADEQLAHGVQAALLISSPSEHTEPQQIADIAEASRAPDITHYQLTEGSAQHDGTWMAALEVASEEPRTWTSPSDKPHESKQCVNYLPLTARICQPDTSVIKEAVLHHQLSLPHQNDRNQSLQGQLRLPRRRLRHRRRRGAPPIAQLQQQGKRQCASQLNTRRSQRRRGFAGTIRHRVHLQHHQSGLLPTQGFLRQRCARRRKRHGHFPGIPDQQRRRRNDPVHRTFEQETPCVCESRRHLSSHGCCVSKPFIMRGTCGARMCRPEYNSQPRPPELCWTSPDCHTFLGSWNEFKARTL